jgi:cell wall-associated NlpC family hydrolase
MLGATALGRRLATFAVASLLAGIGLVAFSSTAVDASGLSREQRIFDAVHVAARQVGDPYSYGSAGPDRFDCSGLMFYSFHHAGFDGLPRSSGDQASFARRINKDNLRRGDFVFYTNSSGSVYHAAMFLGWKHGHRVVLHAQNTGNDVRRTKIYADHWFAATLRKR